MKIFVTGATGVLGRATVPLLLAAGHRVRGLARSTANDTLLRQLGAEPVAVDLADAAGLRVALAGCDAVLHLATKIPPSSAARKETSWLENDRLRREGTNALVDAALAVGVQTLLYPSVTLLYPDSGARWLVAGESTIDPAPNLLSTLVAEEAVARFTTAGGRGIVLRLGSLYGPTAASSRDQLALVRWGVAPLPGAASAYASSLWIDDAARAIVAALDRAPAGLYDVVDDEPLTRAELSAALRGAVGRRSTLALPAFVWRALAGDRLAELLGRSQRVSNRAFKAATGWSPAVPSMRAGAPRLAEALGATPRRGHGGAITTR
jgi:nucleoside-diphosphate-sugar epimerase